MSVFHHSLYLPVKLPIILLYILKELRYLKGIHVTILQLLTLLLLPVLTLLLLQLLTLLFMYYIIIATQCVINICTLYMYMYMYNVHRISGNFCVGKVVL